MAKILIKGGKKLKGEIDLQGAKNSVLPVLAGTLLCDGMSTIHNCPNISDVETSVKILTALGCNCEINGNSITVDPTTACGFEIPDELMREMRSSVVFLGAIIGRFKKGVISSPGGCELGPRPIDLHLSAIKKISKVADFRFLCGIVDYRKTLSFYRRQNYIFRSSHTRKA